MNLIQDTIANFGKLIPGQFLAVDKYGRMAASDHTTEQEVVMVRSHYDYDNEELMIEEEIVDLDRGWIDVGLDINEDKTNIVFNHKYNPID